MEMTESGASTDTGTGASTSTGTSSGTDTTGDSGETVTEEPEEKGETRRERLERLMKRLDGRRIWNNVEDPTAIMDDFEAKLNEGRRVELD